MMHAYHYIGKNEQYLRREPGQPWTATCTCKEFAKPRRGNAKFCNHVALACAQQLKDDTKAYEARIRGEHKKRKLNDIKDLTQFNFNPTVK